MNHLEALYGIQVDNQPVTIEAQLGEDTISIAFDSAVEADAFIEHMSMKYHGIMEVMALKSTNKILLIPKFI